MTRTNRLENPSIGRRIRTLAKSVATGGAATVADMISLVFLVEIAGLSPPVASLPALFVGALVQFLGNRHFVFAARGHERGSLPRQAVLFALAEGATLTLNALVFYLLSSMLGVPYPIARAAGTFLVFAGFSYPIWRRIFVGRGPSSRAEAASAPS